MRSKDRPRGRQDAGWTSSLSLAEKPCGHRRVLTNERHPANVIYNKNNLRQQVKIFAVNERGGEPSGRIRLSRRFRDSRED